MFKSFLIVLYLLGFTALAWFAWTGRTYYETPVKERPHMEQHSMLKPGGLYGHGLGIVGSSMILLLFLYSARKRGRFFLRFGKTARWLDIHIWFGIMGPLFITLHTAMKFGGIVSISYFSMLAVMISGFFGRYIYMQMPRDESGVALSARQIDQRIEDLGEMLRTRYDVPAAVMLKIDSFARVGQKQKTRGLMALVRLIGYDLTRPFRSRRLRSYIRRAYPGIPPKAVSQIAILARRKSLLTRRRAFLETVSNFFHYWHVIHKPFAYVMIVIMFVHITVAVLMGYRWIF